MIDSRLWLFLFTASVALAQGPTITAVSPNSITSGAVATVRIDGTNFCGASVARIRPAASTAGPVSLPTVFQSPAILLATVNPGFFSPGNYLVSVQNPANPSCQSGTSGELPFQILPPDPLEWVTSTLGTATVGADFGIPLQARGGTPPYEFSVQSGSTLPPGLSLTSNGLLSGRPTQAGTFTFTLVLRETCLSFFAEMEMKAGARLGSFSCGSVVTRAFTLVVRSDLRITTTGLPRAKQGVAYSATITAAGGRPPYTFQMQGQVPGLSFNSNGTLSGTPTQAGTFDLLSSVFDQTEARADARFVLVVDPPDLTITTAALPNGQANAAYSQTMAATGGSPPYTWTLQGSVPGLSLSSAGVLSGTPTQSGTFSLTFTVRDSGQRTALRILPLTIGGGGPLRITSERLPIGQVNVAYSTTLAATGGSGSLTWVLTTAAPPGLTLSSAGALAGTPTSAGSFPVGVRVTDSQNNQATSSFTLLVTGGGLQITTAALPAGQVNVAYSTTLAATGGSGSLTWVLTTAAPPGLTLSSAGVLAGTPTSAGSFPVGVRVTDSQNAQATANLSLQVNAVTLQITTLALQPAINGQAYSQPLTAIGGSGALSWTMSGNIPPGLGLEPASGLLSGIPARDGVYDFVVQVRDAAGQTATRNLSLTVGNTLSINNLALKNGTVGLAYEEVFGVTGGTPPYQWSLLGIAVPGLTLNPSLGTLSGVPALAGSFNVTVRVTDALNSSALRSYQVTIDPGFRITTESLPAGRIGVFYEQTLLVTGGVAPFTWSFGGPAPAGIGIGSSTGVLSGTPTEAGSFAFNVVVTDGTGLQTTKPFTLTIGQGLQIQPDSLPNRPQGTAFSQTFTASGGTPPYVFSALTAIPPGLNLNSTGILSGTPTQSGTFELTIRAQDAAGAIGTRAYALVVLPVLRISPGSPPTGVERSPYTHTLTAEGGVTPLSWRLSGGNLPEGLTLTALTGVIAGTPQQPGTTTFTIEVVDSAGQRDSRDFAITIGPRLAITTTATLPNGTIGTPYAAVLAATGGTEPYRWRLRDGTLPAPLILDASGQITGTPTQAGSSNFTAEVTDSGLRTAIAEFSITVNPTILRITSGQIPSATAGSAPLFTATASGGTPPYRFSLVGAPEGLTINEVTGVLGGRVLTPGTFEFTIRVVDSTNASTTVPASLQITLPAPPTVTITGVPATATPPAQFSPGVQIGAPYPLPITGELLLTFNSAVNSDDQAIQFSTGGRRAVFNIPAGQTAAVFNAATLGVQSGTTAGVIRLTVRLNAASTDITPPNAPIVELTISRLAPVITSARLNRTANGFELIVTAFSTGKDLTSATVRLQTTGTVTGGPDFTFNLSAAATEYFRSATSTQFGGLVSLTLPFTVQGTSGSVTGASVTLTNSAGTSTSASASF